VCVDFEEFETVETVSIKADKKLPTVKATAVKLNSFYTENTMPLVLTSGNGEIVSATADSTKTNPDWLILNDDMTVSLKEGFTGKASGKLYLDVMVKGYSTPVKVAVSLSVANTAPKLKLSSTKATFYTFRDNATATTIYLQSNDKKVFFNDIGITDIKVADIPLMTSKDAKTYSANSNYTVTSFDKETGMFTLDTIGEAVSGKVLLEVSVADSDQTVKLPFTVTAYNKAPTFKLSKTSVTINTAYVPAGSTAKVNVTPTPADYAVTTDNFSWVVTDSKNNPVDNVLDVSFENGTVTIKSNENTLSNGKYKVVFTLDGATKPVTLNVTVKPVTMKVSKSSVTLNKLADDSATVTLTTTPADYILSEENLKYTVTDSKNNPVDAVDVVFDGKNVTLSVNENSTYGATYKVNFTLAETGKTSTVTVKTLAENKSVIKLSISAKGKLETGYLNKGVTITPKWTNLMQNVDISENIRVYATAKTKGAVPVDVTDCFNIISTNGTYLLTFKDTESLNKLNPKDKYTVVCEGVTVKGQSVADTKAVTITFTVTKPKVTQSVKSVNLYLNDRYSRGEFKLTLSDKTMPDISAVEIADVKMAEFYQLVDLGGGEYAIEFKDNNIAEKLKTGNIKLNIYLDGNNPEYKTPNTSVSVKVNTVKFKNK
ncbi:MAG: hypothetical protein IKV86_04955, partial [Clostridia bacterium]|nr:hypothetical protein [Clostridia bacterium]